MEKLTQDEAQYIQGYAAALQDILRRITGENTCGKSYDPMTVKDNGATMMSYAFNLKDGGRKHPVNEYESVKEIKGILIEETFAAITLEADITPVNLSGQMSHPLLQHLTP